jgi:hypothetical protein
MSGTAKSSDNTILCSHLRVRYDYYAETQSLVITTPSHVHECGVNAVRRIFEPAMEKCTQRYGKVWPYHTNCAFPLFRSDTDGQIPTGDILTPDGAISDGGARLSLVVEVASAQQLKNAREKLQTYFVDPSVKAGIIMNIDESPAYAAPKYYDDWEWDQKCVTYQEWPELEEGTWGPINFFSYCWGGRFTCQMEVHWPGKGNEVEIVKAVRQRKPDASILNTNLDAQSLIPLGPESDIDDLNMELAAVWSALREPILGNHDSSGSGEDDVEVCMDAGLFQQQLVEELRLTSYNRYAAAFAKFNPKVKTLEAEDKEQKVRDRLFDAAKVRALARDLKRKQLSRDEEVVERFSKVPRVHSDPKS